MEENKNQIDINALTDLLGDGLPAGFLTKLRKAQDPYYRGPTKVHRKRADVLKKRKAAKMARKANRGKTRGQKQVKGQRFSSVR